MLIIPLKNLLQSRLLQNEKKQAHPVYSSLHKLSNTITHDWLSLLTHSTVGINVVLYFHSI